MKMGAAILLLLAVLVCMTVLVVLLSNQARLLTEPGPAARLAVYFKQNSAHSAEQHPFPELRSGEYGIDAAELYRAVQTAIVQLGWELSAVEDDTVAGQYRVHAIVTTPVFRFQDDVTIKITDLGCRQSRGQNRGQNRRYSALDISSASRVGKADLGANAGHIQALHAALGRVLSDSALLAIAPEPERCDL